MHALELLLDDSDEQHARGKLRVWLAGKIEDDLVALAAGALGLQRQRRPRLLFVGGWDFLFGSDEPSRRHAGDGTRRAEALLAQKCRQRHAGRVGFLQRQFGREGERRHAPHDTTIAARRHFGARDPPIAERQPQKTRCSTDH